MLSDKDFEPADWVPWMRALWAQLKMGGSWGAPAPGFVLQKTPKGWKVTTGKPDSRTRLVCKAAGLEIEE
jgi:hypothetical protein